MGFKGAIFMVLLVVACKYLHEFLAMHGVGVHYNNHYPGQCRQVPGIECGSEQISVTRDGLAFITNGFKLLTQCNHKYTPGRIYLFDFNQPDMNAVPLEIVGGSLSLTRDPVAFDPHGMDIIDDGGELVKVYVVNHMNHKETIEKFEFNRNEPTKLKYVGTIRDDKFICINDLALLSEDEFYVTNWIKTCGYPRFVTMLEIYLQLSTAEVVHYRKGHTAVVATGPGLNGVSLSKDRKKLLVAASSSLYLHVYDLPRVLSGDAAVVVPLLKLNRVVLIGHFTDNVYADHTSNGNVYYAGVHKQVHRVKFASENKTTALSSSAVRVTANADWSKVDVEEVFHDNGWDLVKGVSAAVHYNGQYLFGTIFDKLAYCIEEERQQQKPHHHQQ